MDHNHQSSSTIASAYLQEEGNEMHKIWFSQDLLQLFYQGRHRVFEMEQIRRLAFNHRKLMLPFILGGTAASLSLVALLKLFYDPWLMLSILTIGCLLAYWGYKGSWVLTVEEPKTHTDFFLKTISPNLRAFVDYANTFTGRQSKGVLYLPLSFSRWQAAGEKGFFKPDTPARLFFSHELDSIPRKNWVVLPVPTLLEGIFISWKTPEGESSLYPYLEKNSYLPLQEIKPIVRQ